MCVLKRRGVVIFLLLGLCYGSTVSASSRMAGDFAAGLATPAPTGFTLKYWDSNTTAYDFFAEWSFSDNKYNFHADYLVHDFNQIYMEEADVPVYYGVGFRFIAEKDQDLITGVRFPVGVSYILRDKPFDLFGEVAPRMNFTPSTGFGLDAQVGIRFHF